MIGFRELVEKTLDHNDYNNLIKKHYNSNDKILNKGKINALSKNLVDQYNFTKPEHLDVLKRYTGNEFKHINGNLWDKHKNPSSVHSSDSHTDEDIKHMDEAMQVNKTPHAFSVYSGINQHFNPEENKIYHHPGFMSTSLSRSVAHRFIKSNEIENDDSLEFHHHMLHIHVPKGHPGAFVDGISENQKEKEFILPRGTNLKHKFTHTYLKKAKSLGDREAYYHIHHMDIVK